MHDLDGPQFVIQEHTTPDGVHWDLMLESNNSLWTWRLNIPPKQIQKTPIKAERIADHALKFLNYEGPVQNHTGRVRISDKGPLSLETLTPDLIAGCFEGNIFNARFTLHRQTEPAWLFQLHR